MKIKANGIEYELNEEQFNNLKTNLHKRIEVKESVGWQDVAVYMGNLLLGYINIELLKKIIKELKE